MAVAVADPYDAGKRIVASVNRRVDLLEYERSHGNITVSQYEVGRQVQAVFEKASGARIVNEPVGDELAIDRSKRPLIRDQAAIRSIDNAREVQKMMARVEHAVGPVGARMLRELLTSAGTFKDYVEKRDQLAGERKVTQAADRFRFLLEALDETFAAHGAVVKDEDGEARIRAELGTTTGECFDEKGRLVLGGQEYKWGRTSVED